MPSVPNCAYDQDMYVQQTATRHVRHEQHVVSLQVPVCRNHTPLFRRLQGKTNPTVAAGWVIAPIHYLLTGDSSVMPQMWRTSMPPLSKHSTSQHTTAQHDMLAPSVVASTDTR